MLLVLHPLQIVPELTRLLFAARLRIATTHRLHQGHEETLQFHVVVVREQQNSI
jgi:hypothetical protein